MDHRERQSQTTEIILPTLNAVTVAFKEFHFAGQVVLSFGIPFALIPLVIFTRRRDIMGALVNLRITTAIASAVATLIVALNLYLLYGVFSDIFGGGR